MISRRIAPALFFPLAFAVSAFAGTEATRIASPGAGIVATGVERRSADDFWKNDFGKRSRVSDRYDEIRVHLREDRGDKPAVNFDLVVRAGDEPEIPMVRNGGFAAKITPKK